MIRLDRTVLSIGSYGPTPVLGVHRISTFARFFMLKKPVFIPVPDFHGLTSRSGPVLRIMYYIIAWSHAWALSMLATASHTNFIVCLILLAVAKAKAKNKNSKLALSIIMALHSFSACTLFYIYIYIYSCRTVYNLLSCNQFSTLLWLTYWFNSNYFYATYGNNFWFPTVFRQFMG